MMGNLFYSKSSSKVKAKAEKTEMVFSKTNPIQVGVAINNDFIAWIGRDLPKYNLYGFKNIDIIKSDLSVLVNAKLLIAVFTVYSLKVNAAVNFAFEHGIPILWINSTCPPKDKAWFFNAVSNDVCWELICQMAK